MTLERAPRFLEIELRYGRHDRSFSFPVAPRPTVLCGPNGSGKTTLLESVVRTLFGYNRNLGEDRLAFGERQPWEGEDYQAELLLQTGQGGRVRVRRDFRTDRVSALVDAGEDGEETALFRGEANPGGRGRELDEFRERLEGWIGIDRLELYRDTAFVPQGRLGETTLGDRLLRAAAGGHGAYGPACEKVRERYYALTVEPIAESDKKHTRPGEIERLEGRLEDLRARLSRAREAAERRGPLVEERETHAAEERRLEERIQLLERALEPLSARGEAKERLAGLEARIERCAERREALREARQRLERAEASWAEHARGEPYPEDFPSRVGAAQELWERLEQLREAEEERQRALAARPAPGPAVRLAGPVVGGALLLAGAGLFAVGWRGIGLVVALVGLLAGILLWARARRRASDRNAAQRGLGAAVEARREAEDKLASRLEGVPEAETLTPETLPDRRRHFEAQRAARDGIDAARERLAEERTRARDVFEGPGGPPPADRLEARLVERIETLRNEYAEAKHEMKRTAADLPELPDEIAPTAVAVREALAELRERRGSARDAREEAERRLRTEGRPEESPEVLERQLAVAARSLEEAREETLAHRRAYRLLTDAYEEFRRGDQSRLVEAVSAQLRGISGGRLGPLVAEEGDLAGARVEAYGRRLPLTSPPLSFGERHAALLAVRLGTADFLGQTGIRPPLLLDEPFAHLDESRAAQLWEMLRRIATERQVIVATQDRLVLEHLGIEPDLRLGEPSPTGEEG